MDASCYKVFTCWWHRILGDWRMSSQRYCGYGDNLMRCTGFFAVGLLRHRQLENRSQHYSKRPCLHQMESLMSCKRQFALAMTIRQRKDVPSLSLRHEMKRYWISSQRAWSVLSVPCPVSRREFYFQRLNLGTFEWPLILVYYVRFFRGCVCLCLSCWLGSELTYKISTTGSICSSLRSEIRYIYLRALSK